MATTYTVTLGNTEYNVVTNTTIFSVIRGASGSAADFAALIHAATDKATPVDADEIGITDSAASWALKGLTWANLKTYIGGGTELPVGTIVRSSQTPGATWLSCDGAAYAQASYTDLYAELGLMHDFSSWDNSNSVTNGIFGFAEGNGVVVAGSYSSIHTSANNGDSWSAPISAGSAGNYPAYIPGIGRFVIGCGSGRIYTSDNDGVSWTRRDVDASDPLSGNAVGGAVWDGTNVVLVAAGGKTAYSTDGINWTAVAAGATAFVGIANGNDTLVAITGTTATKYYSIDHGVNWVACVSAALGASADIVWSDSYQRFIEVGTSNLFRTSITGKTWESPITVVGHRYAVLDVDGVIFTGFSSVTGWTSIITGLSLASISPGPYWSAQNVKCLFRTSDGSILCGQKTSTTGYLGKMAFGYNTATSFRVPKAGLDAGTYSDSWINAGV